MRAKWKKKRMRRLKRKRRKMRQRSNHATLPRARHPRVATHLARNSPPSRAPQGPVLWYVCIFSDKVLERLFSKVGTNGFCVLWLEAAGKLILGLNQMFLDGGCGVAIVVDEDETASARVRKRRRVLFSFRDEGQVEEEAYEEAEEEAPKDETEIQVVR
ncbi:hypothetical protein JHK85_005647 [Glycine max]|nr:hypothetical protein JHK85_005647 [Glycine max]KAG5081421.1 hypothetical protein JHK86_005486 [Glycine max]